MRINDFTKDNSGLNPLITSIFLLGISITGIILVMQIGMPAIERSRDSTIFVESRNNMNSLANTIETIAYSSEGTSRNINMDVTDGIYEFGSNSITYSYDLTEDILSPGLCQQTGDLMVKTYGSNRLLDYRFNAIDNGYIMDCSVKNNDGYLEEGNTGEIVVTGYGEAIRLDEENKINVGDSILPLEDDFSVSIFLNASLTNDVVLIEQGGFNISLDDLNIDPDVWYHVVITRTGEEIDVYVDNEHVYSEQLESLEEMDTIVGDNFEGLIESVLIFDIVLNEEEKEHLGRGGMIGEVEGFELKYVKDNIVLDSGFELGSGRHSLYLRHDGISEDKVNIRIDHV